MWSIIIQIVVVAALVGFLIFLARDDMRNQKIREEEEREEALALERARQKSEEERSDDKER